MAQLCLTPLGAREGVKLIPTPLVAPLIASEARLVGEKCSGWGGYSGDLTRLEFFLSFLKGPWYIILPPYLTSTDIYMFCPFSIP